MFNCKIKLTTILENDILSILLFNRKLSRQPTENNIIIAFSLAANKFVHDKILFFLHDKILDVQNIPTLLLRVYENLLDLQYTYFNFLFLLLCITLYNFSNLTNIFFEFTQINFSSMMLSYTTGNIVLHHKINITSNNIILLLNFVFWNTTTDVRKTFSN